MTVIAVTLVFMVLLGAFTLGYQVYQLVVLVAKSRGLKHPKFWGIFSIGGNNGGGGLVLYLLGRNRYPSHMTDDVRKICCSRKKKSALSLCFIVAGTIGLISIALFGNPGSFF